MAFVYFGYIARMTRAGTIEVLQSDYTRTATMKGLTTSQAMIRHVLRNALIPTVAVIAVQIGYLFGGIIAVERIFNYNGMGQTMLFAAERKDIPTLTAGAIIIGIVYMVATLVADLVIAWMNPRIRLERIIVMDVPIAPSPAAAPVAPTVHAGSVGTNASSARDHSPVLLRRPAFIIGILVDGRLGRHGGPRRAHHSVRSVQRLQRTDSQVAARARTPNTCSAQTGSVATSSRA